MGNTPYQSNAMFATRNIVEPASRGRNELDLSPEEPVKPRGMPTFQKAHPMPDEKSSNLSEQSSNAKQKKNPIQFTSNQIDELALPFNVGCPMWFQFDKIDDSTGELEFSVGFRTGVISAIFMEVWSREVFYEVKTIGAGTKLTEMIPEKNLCCAPKCPVNIAPPISDIQSTNMQGEVLMCRALSHQQVSIHSVLQLKESLMREQGLLSSQDDTKLLGVLDRLDRIQMSRQILIETLIGKQVRKLAKLHGKSDAAEKAHVLVRKWKGIANKERNQTDAERGQTSKNSPESPCAFLYTILIIKQGNQFYVEENVLSNRVTYRNDTMAGGIEENESSNSTITTPTGLR